MVMQSIEGLGKVNPVKEAMQDDAYTGKDSMFISERISEFQYLK